MSKKDRFKEKLINWFFEDESLRDEERLAAERVEDVFICKAFSLIFHISAIIIIVLFYLGKFNIHDGFGAEILMFAIAFGLGALYFDWKIRKVDKGKEK